MAKNTVVISVLADTKKFSEGMKSSTGILGKIGSVGKTAAKVVGGIGLALGGLAAAGGFARALKMDEANTQLQALGYNSKQVTGIMDSALKSVKGTAFGLDAAATIAANALASGVPEGERLTAALTTVANTAALAKVDMSEMGAIFQKVWANGKVTTAEMNQLADRGVPIWQYLSESFGVSNEELRKMIASGEVTADMFENALGPAVDGMATKMSNSLKGMAANAGASLSRLGALFATGLIQPMKDTLGEFTILTDGIAERLKPLADRLNEFLGGIKITGLADKILSAFDNLGPGMSDGFTNAIMSAVQSMNDWLAGGGLASVFQQISTAREGFLNAALTALPGIIDAIVQIAPQILQGITTLLVQLVQFIAGEAPAILGAAVQMLTGLIDGVVQIIPSLIDALVTLLPVILTALLDMLPAILDGAVTLFTSIIDAIPVILPKLIAAIIGMLPTITTTLLTMPVQILAAAVKLFTAIVTAIPKIVPNLIKELVAIGPKMVPQILRMGPQLLTAGKSLFMALVNAVPAIAGAFAPQILRLGPKMVGAVRRMIPQMLNAGRDLVQGLANGLWRAAGAVVNNLLGIAQNAIGAFKSFFGIQSPSRLMDDMGVFIDRGLAGGINRGLRHVRNAVRGLNGAVTDEFNADLTAGTLTVNRSTNTTPGADGAVQRVYNITLQAIAPSAEVGRAVVNAIDAYERAITRQPRGALA